MTAVAPRLLPALFCCFAIGVGGVWGIAVASMGQQTLEFRDGRWVDVADAPEDAGGGVTRESVITTAPGDLTLSAVDRLIAEGDYRLARGEVLAWLLANPQASDRDRALLLMAEALIGLRDGLKAFYYLDELLDTIPTSEFYGQALRRQYDIADDFLGGGRQRWLKLPILGGTTQAIEMLFRIQERAPGSPLAQQAMRRTADFYYDDGQFDLAGDTYGAYLGSYPTAPDAAEVRLRQAFSNLARYRGLQFDPTPVIDARTQLTQLAAAYPEVAEREDVPALLARIDRALARQTLSRATFYERTGRITAAARLYDRVRGEYPSLPEASEAGDRLARLDVPDTPADPPPTSGGADVQSAPSDRLRVTPTDPGTAGPLPTDQPGLLFPGEVRP